eukprot:jgi/Mesvir1/16471/Mv25057-RA.1
MRIPEKPAGEAAVDPWRGNPIVVGVLDKWVNLGKGWQPRCFVLDKGVLRYYKLHGGHKIRITAVMAQATVGNTTAKLIGERTQKIASKEKKSVEEKKAWGAGSNAKSLGEVHLLVATVRASGSDHKRFYIDTGTRTLSVRAGTVEERWEWLELLNKNKVKCEEGAGGAEAVQQLDPLLELTRRNMAEVQEAMDAVRRRLTEESVSEDAINFCMDIFDREVTGLMTKLQRERHKNRITMEYVRTLESEKRELEATVVLDHQEALVSALAEGEFLEDRPERVNPEQASVGGSVRGGSSSEDEFDDEDLSEEKFFDALELDSDSPLARAGRGGHALNGLTFSPRSGSTPNKKGLLGGPRGSGGDASADMFSPLRAHGRESSIGSDGTFMVDAEDGSIGDKSGKSVGGNIVVARRRKLPDPVEQEKSVSLWAIIKDNVGKDLSKVCLPVYFNEPLSALQKAAEDMEYSYLLDMAREMPKGSVERMARVGAFAVSGYAATKGRTQKPFNPLLGETYECIREEQGFHFIAEKVSHHPTIINAYCKGTGWAMDAECNMKSKFWGRSIEVIPVGHIVLTFDDGETFMWNKVNSSIYNLIIGKLYVDHHGVMKVTSNATTNVLKIRFKEQGILGGVPHQVKGHIHDEDGNNLAHMSGEWDGSLWYAPGDESIKGDSAIQLWEASPPPEFPTRYNFTSYAITLNELTDDLKERIAPTDSRLRPDQRCLEQGRYDQANAEKLRLEQKQREARKNADMGAAYEPRWFKRNAGGDGSNEFMYAGGYFEAREKRNFEGCKDIFS